jgi:phosphoglucomutase
MKSRSIDLATQRLQHHESLATMSITRTRGYSVQGGLMNASLPEIYLARHDGTVWRTDKDGMIMGLLAAEMTAVMGRDPAELYQQLTRELGEPVYQRLDASATPEQKSLLAQLSPQQVRATELAGEKITGMLTTAPGDDAPIGGLKVTTANGWLAARPSGTEDVYKIYAESFQGADHLHRLLDDAQALIDKALATAPRSNSRGGHL